MAGQSLTEGYLDGFKVSTVLRLASSCISLYTSLMSHSGTSGTFLEMEFLDQKFFSDQVLHAEWYRQYVSTESGFEYLATN